MSRRRPKRCPLFFHSWRGEIMRAAEAWRPRRGRRLIRRILPLALIATLAIFFTGCGSAAFEAASCPTWPEAGPLAAEEVERGMMPADRFPAFWEWMGRADKLPDQLSDCCGIGGATPSQQASMTPHCGQRICACSSRTCEPQRRQIAGGESVMPFSSRRENH